MLLFIQNHWNAVKKLHPIQLLLYFVGIFFISLGVVLTIQSRAGASGFDSLNFAISDLLQIRTSFVIYFLSFIFILIAAAIRRSRLKLETFLSALLTGSMIDLWKIALQKIYATSLWSSIVLLLLGTVLLGFGVAAYILSKLPTSPIDDLVLAIHEKNVTLRTAKLTIDFSCLFLAFVLGGIVGWGSLVLSIGLGPLIQLWSKYIVALLAKFSYNP